MDMEALESIIVALGVLIILVVIILIAYAIFNIVGMWKMYKKAGKGGWEAIIPFYSDYVLAEVAGLKWYWFLILIAPTLISLLGITALTALGNIVALVARINVYYNLAKKFNKQSSWIVLSVFFGGFTLPILGYSSNDKYDASAETTPNGFVDGMINKNNTTNTNNSSDTSDKESK